MIPALFIIAVGLVTLYATPAIPLPLGEDWTLEQYTAAFQVTVSCLVLVIGVLVLAATTGAKR